MGKAEGNGIYSAFVGFNEATSKIGLPYVRWATDTDFLYNNGQRTYIAIQNIGGTTIPAGGLTIKYYDRDGVLQATDTNPTSIADGIKYNSNANKAGLSEFGYYHPGAGGSAIVEGPSGSQLAIIARVQGFDASTWLDNGEDYNGMDIAQ